MLIEMLRAKLHRVRVTGASLHYVGSLTLPRDVLEASGIRVGEKIAVANVTNGARFETYAQAGKRGQCTLNGAAARLGAIGDVLIVFAYALLDEAEAARHRPRILLFDEKNRVARAMGPKPKRPAPRRPARGRA
jgi:aspartate 1-decarboxylase